jgi:hypothetical protein
LIYSGAQNAEDDQIAFNRNVSGTRDLPFA